MLSSRDSYNIRKDIRGISHDIYTSWRSKCRKRRRRRSRSRKKKILSKLLIRVHLGHTSVNYFYFIKRAIPKTGPVQSP